MRKKKTNLIQFISLGENEKEDKSIIDHGKIDDLNYEVYTRGSVHIIDKKGLIFKKDPLLFEEAIDQLDLDSLKDGKEAIIEAAGDNPDLIFKKIDGDIKLSLRKKEYGTINKLKNVLKKAKKRNKKKRKVT